MEIFKLFGSIFVDNEKANKNLQETDQKAGGVGATFGKLGGMVAAAGVAVVAAIGTMVVKSTMLADELQGAMNKVQTSTGATVEEMQGLEQILLNIYGANFGQSLDDVAESLAEVKKQTGLTGKALEEATIQALLMRDTFGMPIQESIRAVDMLTKQFGITSKEAYTLIAQGAQEGLDKNGNLLDTINEYAPHFKTIGLNADEMFNSLANGAATGVFDIDKLGDAIKEFGIRSKDLSKTSLEAFDSLGLNGKEISAQFAKGGENAKLAFDKVANGLAGVKDPLKQNTIGTALFGTQWEDVGAKGIIALTDLKGSIKGTNKTLEDINKIKYNTFGEALDGIGRQFQTGIMIPLGQNVLPILNTFANWILKNMPFIQGVASKAFDIMGAVFSYVGDIIEAFMPTFEAWYNSALLILPAYSKLFKVAFDAIKVAIGLLADALTFMYQAFQASFFLVQKLVINTATGISVAMSNIKLAILNSVSKILEGVLEIGKHIPGLAGQLEKAKSAIDGMIDTEKAKKNATILNAEMKQSALTVSLLEIQTKKYKEEAEKTGVVNQEYAATVKAKDEAVKKSVVSTEKAKVSEKELQEQLKKNVELLDTLGGAIVTALKNRYEASEKLAIANKDKEIKTAKELSDSKIAGYDKEYKAKLKTLDADTQEAIKKLQGDIDLVTDQTKKEEEILKEQERAKRELELQSAVASAATSEEKASAELALREFVAADERAKILKSRELQIAAFNNEIQRIKDNAEIKKAQIDEEYASKKTSEENLLKLSLTTLENEKEALSRHYEVLKAEENIQAEARRLAISKGNDDVINLLKEYNPKWQDAGQSFGESLLNGLNSKKAEIQSVVNSILSLVAQTGQTVTPAPVRDNQREYLESLLNSGTPGQKAWAKDQLSRYPKLANGGTVVSPGRIIVGEAGTEILDVPSGATVTPLKGVGGVNIYITGNTILGEDDPAMDRIGNFFVNRLREAGAI